jgi:hypothetical protein
VCGGGGGESLADMPARAARQLVRREPSRESRRPGGERKAERRGLSAVKLADVMYLVSDSVQILQPSKAKTPPRRRKCGRHPGITPHFCGHLENQRVVLRDEGARAFGEAGEWQSVRERR